jgi:hypothetical protein
MSRFELPILIGLAGCSCQDQGIQAVNADPSAEILSHQDGAEVVAGETLALRGAVSDPDHDDQALTVSWWLGSDRVCGPEAPEDGGATGCDMIPQLGDTQVTLEVQDPRGAGASQVLEIVVLPANGAPTCGITAPQPNTVFQLGEAVTIEGWVEDVEDEPEAIAVAWASDLDGALGSSEPDGQGGVTLTTSALTMGMHTIGLRATDSGGAICEDSVSLTVGNPPRVSISDPVDGAVVNEGEELLLVGSVSDAEDAPASLSLTWYSDLDGTISRAPADAHGAATASTATLSTGVHDITLRAIDSDSLQGSATVSVTVNALPTAPTVSLSPSPAHTTDDLVATASGSSDPDGSGSISYGYAWYEDGTLSSSSSSATFPASATTKGSEYRVVVTPSDGTGEGPSAEASLTVANSAPVIGAATITPSSGVTTRTSLGCTATATDPDGDSPGMSYAWSGDAGALGSGTSLDLDTGITSPGDTITCTATATDDDGATATSTDTVTVDNTDPVLGTVSISPSSGVTTSSTLVCSASASDADGGTPTLAYAWTHGATSLGSSSSLTLDPGTSSPGDTITCTVTASDAHGGSDSGAASVSVRNSAPSVATVSITPAVPFADDTLSCSYTGYSDPDGDPDASSFAWTVEGVAAGTGSSLAGAFGRDDAVTCTVTPSDGSATGTPVSATVTIRNTPPVLTAVSLSPTTATTDTTLAAAVSATDLDGDTVTYSYAWSVDGSAVAATGSSLSGVSWFDKHQTVQLTVTPGDGTDSGASVSSSVVTVLNTPPEAPSLGIDPAAPREGFEDLLCEVVAASHDDDGDGVSYTMSWEVDGLAYTAGGGDTGDTGAAWVGPYTTTWPGDSVPGEDTREGEVWSCTATPDDGDDAGTDGSADVTIEPWVVEICTLEITDPASSSSTNCSFEPTESGVLRATMSNPDASLDGIFSVGSHTTGYLYLSTGARQWMYQGPQTQGWTSYDAELNVEPSMGSLTLDAAYSTEGGSEFTGTDTLRVEFVPGLSLSTTGATLIASSSVGATDTTATNASATIPVGGRLLVHASSCGSGGGAQAVYADDDSNDTNDGFIKLYTGSSYLCGNPLQSHSIDAGSWDFSLVNEDDYWGDNSGTRAFELYYHLR